MLTSIARLSELRSFILQLNAKAVDSRVGLIQHVIKRGLLQPNTFIIIYWRSPLGVKITLSNTHALNVINKTRIYGIKMSYSLPISTYAREISYSKKTRLLSVSKRVYSDFKDTLRTPFNLTCVGLFMPQVSKPDLF